MSKKNHFFITLVLSALFIFNSCTISKCLFGSISHSKINHITDSQGGIVIYHGVNGSNWSKHSPDNLPWYTPADYKRMNDWGFNMMRFMIFWSAIEPNKGEYDHDYLAKLSDHFRTMDSLGINVILDFHQDLYADTFTGNGAPDWAIKDNGLPFNKRKPWSVNYLEPAVIASFTNFWKNVDGIQSQYIKTMVFVAQRFSRHSNIIGIDPFNEPYTGALINLEPYELTAFYKKVQDAFEIENIKMRIFFEPVMYKSTGLPTRLTFTPDGLCAYFPHYYDALIDYNIMKKYKESNWRLMKAAIEIKVVEAQQFGTPLLFGEFGVGEVDNYLQYYDDFMYLSDKYCFGWTVYSYDSLKYGEFGIIDNDGQERPQMQKLVRVYPQRIAGKNPRWEINNNVFELRYETDVSVKGPTRIFIPKHFPVVQIIINGRINRFEGGGVFEYINDENKKQKIEVIWN